MKKAETVQSVLRNGECKIQLLSKREDGSFNAGGKVEAIVRLQLTEALEVRGLVAKLHGYAKTEWNDSVGPNSFRRGGRQEIINLESKIFRAMSSGVKTYNAGPHEFRVKFDLPKAVPSSFEGSNGFIRYILYVLAQTNAKTEMLDPKNVHVICPLDLNMDPINGVPWHRSENKDVGLFPCIAGKVSMTLQVDKRGYCPGETIALFGQIHNNSRMVIAFSRCSLIQRVRYLQDKWHDFVEKKSVVSIKHDSTDPGCTDSWNGDELKIPDDVTTNLDHCRLIQVKYTLKVEVKVRFAKTYELLSIVLRMGNIPSTKATRSPFPFQ
ncbi:arrestin domain-containing protein 4-like [Mizuhopecten yessoensis]|uniref:Arrestin domain-containing protein 2 n=1 Tax=Mizuhopecten yessoensis TaxID=6573 RepID=A0A210QDY4_MIZYE|nr:arrestin domain-containing protein 4-like [Mizuhopecten yessoensis]OWF46929.1 Arrestin domain-containing protein 2 [Mizuhopecten yessoensis]